MLSKVVCAIVLSALFACVSGFALFPLGGAGAGAAGAAEAGSFGLGGLPLGLGLGGAGAYGAAGAGAGSGLWNPSWVFGSLGGLHPHMPMVPHMMPF